jgi:acetoin utilization protein AcuC
LLSNRLREEQAIVAPGMYEVVGEKEIIQALQNQNYSELAGELVAKENRSYDADTPVSEEILEAALLIAGGAIKCGETVHMGNAARGISLGGGYHHAGRSYGGGFCLFNNLSMWEDAIAFRDLVQASL